MARRLGLRVQIVVSLAVLLGIALSSMGFLVLALVRATVVSQGVEQATVVARALATDLDRARASSGRLEEVAERALGAAGVDEIAVWDAAGHESLHVSLPGRRGRLADAGPHVAVAAEVLVEGPGPPRLVAVRPLTDPRGVVAIDVSLQEPLETLDRLRRMTVLYVCVAAIALLVFGFVAMTRLIVRPVTALRHAAERVAAGLLDTRVPVEGGSEMADLAHSFNLMTARLREQQAELERKLGELEQKTRDLEAVQSHLVRSAKLASVGQLAAGVAHEIGNPVSAILGFCEILAAGDVPADEARDFVLRMTKEAERMNRIIRDLLDYARPTREAVSELDGCDLGSVVEDSTSLLAPQKNFREVDVERVIPENLPRVRGSRERLTQVLVNLLINAADAMGGQGLVRVGAESIEGFTGPDGAEVSRAVRVKVADSGPGIPSEMLTRVFDPFFTTKEPGLGTGLGLAVCQGLVAAMGGVINAENDPAGGAVFTIVLPAVD
ncbi:MAG: HAMP domain-containing protein [Deltaproteobacteria bacterium]|nr:HAMP domain-containing protein [Deltaproteobacteria bacterium]